MGRLDEAEAELAKLATAPRVEPYFELRAWLALQRRDLAGAFDEAQSALKMATERGRTLYRMLDLALLAQICAQAGLHDQARDRLCSYRALASGVPGDYASFHAAVVEAYLALQMPITRRAVPLSTARSPSEAETAIAVTGGSTHR